VTTGAAGAPATRAAAVYRPMFWVSCSAVLDIISTSSGSPVPGQDGLGESHLGYTVTLYTTRDVDVSCTSEAGPNMGSGSNFYPAIVKGAQSGGCVAATDLPPIPSGVSETGFWDFTIEQGGPVATYMDDASHPLNGYRHVFTQAECNANKLSDDLTWTQVTLADVFR
jgi:hypothetical protein